MNIKGVLLPFSALKQAGKKPHTLNYPYEEKETAARYRGLHYNEIDDCIGCGSCSTICQNTAIDMIRIDGVEAKNGDSGLRPRVDNGRCCWCALCVEVCPTGSLSLTTDYNFISDDPEDFLWTPGINNPDGNSKRSFVSSKTESLLDYPRVPMRELDGSDRIKSFAEVVLGYNDEEARKEAERCLGCGLCTENCPAHMHIPEYINAISRGDMATAVKIIYDNNPMPEMCGKVCTRRCEEICALEKRGESVAIRWLKAYATGTVENADLIKEIVNPEILSENGHSVGIIGAGPSGLTVAYYLALRGFKVQIYESKAHHGGMTYYGIPKYRFPQDSLDKQIDYMKKMGVNIKYNCKVGKDITLEALHNAHDAVFIGIGFEVPYTLGMDGEDLPGSIQAVDFLRDVNAGMKVDVGKSVAVIGGGNVAIDAARLSRRLGAEVTILYRRRVQDMPADWEEIEGAEDEGVHIHAQGIPMHVVAGDDGKVKAVHYANAEMIADAKGGRPRPKMIEGDEHDLPIDTLIGAIGQEADYAFIPEELKEKIEFKWGRILTNDSMQTGVDWIFAGGDIVNNTADAISAIADGIKAVKGIEKFILKK